jgi:hypothetical protein
VPAPVRLSPVAKFFSNFRCNQKIGHMVQKVFYPHPNHIRFGLAIMTIREHLCGYYQLWTRCVDADTDVDPDSGHEVCSGCGRVTVTSGLRKCDICDREYIDLTKHQDNAYETNCPACVKEYDLDDD